MCVCVRVYEVFLFLSLKEKHWLLQQDDVEESARAALWREELIEEIEQKVGGLRELEEAGRK